MADWLREVCPFEKGCFMLKRILVACVLTALIVCSASSAAETKKYVYLPQNLNNPFYTTIADTFAEIYGAEGH